MQYWFQSCVVRTCAWRERTFCSHISRKHVKNAMYSNTCLVTRLQGWEKGKRAVQDYAWWAKLVRQSSGGRVAHGCLPPALRWLGKGNDSMVVWPIGSPSQRQSGQGLGVSCILAPFYHCDKILSLKATWGRKGFCFSWHSVLLRLQFLCSDSEQVFPRGFHLHDAVLLLITPDFSRLS